MKAIVSFLVICAIGGLAGSAFGWQEIQRLRAENLALKAQARESAAKASESLEALEASHESKVKKLEAEAKEVFKLRGEVSQLRGGAKAISQLQEANRKLVSENRSLRTASEATNLEPEAQSQGNFPKENWEFLGYTTPEDALISAIWSMQQGDPQAYFDSLAPEEQERMSARWEEKSEQEVSDKHQSDVAAISGLQVLNRRDLSQTEVEMDVYIDGVGRMETVSMQRVGEDWKFKGYVRSEGQE